MNVGMNTLIEQTKKEMADLINDKLTKGMPIGVIGLMLDSLMYEVRDNINASVAQEQEKAKEQDKTESEQVEYVPPTN